MQDIARVGSKGRITIPKAVREALCLKKGNSVLFTYDGSEATIRRIPGLMEIAGAVEVPEDKRGVPWKEIRAEAWRKRVAERMSR